MDWQKIISLMIVALAAFLMIRSEIRKYNLRKTRLCGGDCNCSIKHIASRMEKTGSREERKFGRLKGKEVKRLKDKKIKRKKGKLPDQL